MKDVNIFSGIKHILSQTALPYHSYIYTSKNKSNFYLKFSICGWNYRIDDPQNFLQILKSFFGLVHAISGGYRHLFFSSFKKKKTNRKKICRDMSDWITHSEWTEFLYYEHIFTRLHDVVEPKLPEARISVAQNATILEGPIV